MNDPNADTIRKYFDWETARLKDSLASKKALDRIIRDHAASTMDALGQKVCGLVPYNTSTGGIGTYPSATSVLALSGYSQAMFALTTNPPMTKTDYLIIRADNSAVYTVLTNTTLDGAKAEARRLAHRDQTEYFVCKAIYAVAPKMAVTEEDL